MQSLRFNGEGVPCVPQAQNRYMAVGASLSALPTAQKPSQIVRPQTLIAPRNQILLGKADKVEINKRKQKVEAEALLELKKQKKFLEKLMGASIDKKTCDSMIADKTTYLKDKVADLEQMKKKGIVQKK